MKHGILVAATLLLSLLVWGCEHQAADHEQHALGQSGTPLMLAETSLKEVKSAIAVLHPLGDSKVQGTVRLTQEGDKVKMVAEVSGLEPNTKHGFHVHEYGDCSKPDGSSAGGHYNPEGHQHAGPDAGQRHAGDFGNLEADAQGKARLELTVDNISIAGERNPVIGRAVIVHAQADDLKSQPTGNAGGRIACGVIGVAQPAQPGQ